MGILLTGRIRVSLPIGACLSCRCYRLLVVRRLSIVGIVVVAVLATTATSSTGTAAAAAAAAVVLLSLQKKVSDQPDQGKSPG